VLLVATGQIAEGILKAFRSASEAFSVWILPYLLNHRPHQAGYAGSALDLRLIFGHAQLFDTFLFIRHALLPSGSPAYSKLLRPVSSRRIRASRAPGNVFKRLKISMVRFSV